MKLIDPIIQFHSELQQIRRDIHAHPELSYEEQRTSGVVAQKLTEWGIPILLGMGITGVLKPVEQAFFCQQTLDEGQVAFLVLGG